MDKILKGVFLGVIIILLIGIYKIKTYENMYIKNVADSALYFQNPSRVLLKVDCLFDEAMFNIHKYQNHKLKDLIKAKILLLSSKSLLQNKQTYKPLIDIINDLLLKIDYHQRIDESVFKKFHKELNKISFLEFKHSIKFFEKYKKDVQEFQVILYTIFGIVVLLTVALLFILYQSTLLRKITILSETDQLTKAYNRRKFFNEISHCKDYAIVMFDIDHFKTINDTYGHDKGDYVLQTLIQVIKNNIRKDDMIFRWGGEEFFILFKNMDLSTAFKMAEKLRKIVENYDFNGLKITISLSVTTANNENIDKVIKLLDEGLYEAKSNGRNKVIIKGDR